MHWINCLYSFYCLIGCIEETFSNKTIQCEWKFFNIISFFHFREDDCFFFHRFCLPELKWYLKRKRDTPIKNRSTWIFNRIPTTRFQFSVFCFCGFEKFSVNAFHFSLSSFSCDILWKGAGRCLVIFFGRPRLLLLLMLSPKPEHSALNTCYVIVFCGKFLFHSFRFSFKFEIIGSMK